MVLAVGLASCSAVEKKDQSPSTAPLFVQQVPFEQLPGWNNDQQSQALTALKQSCTRILRVDPARSMGAEGIAGTYADWQRACQEIDVVSPEDDAQARAVLTQHFAAYQVFAGDKKEGLFTGYYEPLLRGSRERKEPYTVPLYNRPTDLVAVNLGEFRKDLRNEMIYGRVQDGVLRPYYNRQAIDRGALQDTPEVVWVDNAVDAFFLHIQGSGRVQLEDGTLLKIGYAAQNGHPYTAIGAELVKRGALQKEEVSMQSIRQWLETNSGQAADVMQVNASYVFFREVIDEDPLQAAVGAEGVPLTVGRSMAVDRRKIPYGVPVWIDVEHPQDPQNKRLQRLMVAQDTGGAIRGAIRGDVFWGMGEQAAYLAGIMKSRGHAYLLLPRDVIIPEDKRPVRHWFGFFQ